MATWQYRIQQYRPGAASARLSRVDPVSAEEMTARLAEGAAS